MRILTCIFLLLPLPLLAQTPAAHQHGAAMPSDVPAAAHAMLMQAHGGTRNGLILGERLETLPALDLRAWEGQGWYGTDRDKLWIKTEGEYDTAANTLDDGELQLLFSRAVAPYWDLQTGLRVSDGPGPTRTSAVLGLMGLAPYWFEVDLAAFLDERGTLSTRAEVEYELRLTQRLLLQPRLELNYSFADDAAVGMGQGISDAAWGLRLRYEWRREFAPYVGVERHAVFGGTATLRERAGDDTMETSWMAGLRFWY